MKKVYSHLGCAILFIACSLQISPVLSQTTNIIANNPQLKDNVSEEFQVIKKQKKDAEKLLLSKKDSISLITSERDSLKLALVKKEKEIKKSLQEREALASEAFTKGVRSKEWSELNKEYKKNVQNFVVLYKEKEQLKIRLAEIEERKSLSEKDLKNQKVLLSQLDGQLKENGFRKALAKNE